MDTEVSYSKSGQTVTYALTTGEIVEASIIWTDACAAKVQLPNGDITTVGLEFITF